MDLSVGAVPATKPPERQIMQNTAASTTHFHASTSLAAEIIARLKVSDPVPVTIGRKDRKHLQVESVTMDGVKLSVINKHGVLMGYAWLEPLHIQDKDTGLPAFDYVVQRVEKWSDKCASLKRVVYTTLSSARLAKLIAAA